MYQIRFRLGLRIGPRWEAYSATRPPYLDLRGQLQREGRRGRTEGEGKGGETGEEGRGRKGRERDESVEEEKEDRGGKKTSERLFPQF